METKVELGDEVKSEVSSIRGIAVGISRELYGCNRITIQPQDPEEKTVLDSYEVDDVRVQVLVKQKVKPILEHLPKVEFELGDEVYDETTDFKGIVLALTTSLNGCIYAKVQSKRNGEGKSYNDFQHVYRYVKTAAQKEKDARAAEVKTEPRRKSASGGFECKVRR